MAQTFAQLPLSGNVKWLIEFPPAWSWFLSWSRGSVPEHFKDPSSWASRSRASPAATPASSSASSSMASAPAPGSSSAFQLPSQASDQSLGTTCKAPSMASASPAAVPQPAYDQPPQCPVAPVPKQSAAFAAPTRKMTSSAPASVASSPCSAPVSLPAPLPQPPLVQWQTRCIQQPVPLAQFEDFLAQDTEQNSPPEEQPTLVHAVARDMDDVQQADHIREQTWHRQEVEKRRKMMAQPVWKTAMEHQQRFCLAISQYFSRQQH